MQSIDDKLDFFVVLLPLENPDLVLEVKCSFILFLKL